MSTAEHPHRIAVPPLVEGDRLDQPEFHRRYDAMPPDTHAELIQGVVFMPSPVGPEHGRAHVPALVWLSYYAENTPGVETLDNTSTVLGPKSEPQPDAVLRILTEYGGRSQTDRRFVRGVPELVMEVSHTTRFADLGPKRDDYERAGVREYVVRALEPDEVLWHVLQDGRLVVVAPDADGLYRSRAFPGLWLDPVALVSGDTRGLRAAVDRGLATAEHAQFVDRLAANRVTGG
ncbi:MAG: Uma2 family endonuclease [Isosphaeraceae bacterium]|nr:Uma2 family endonuclease [Isosphaeraceae bacterium]